MKTGLPKAGYSVQSVLLFAVYLAFAANAVGLTNVRVAGEPGLGLHTQLVGDVLAGRLPAALAGPGVLAFLAVGAVLALVLPWLKPIGASVLALFAALPPFYVAWAHPAPPPLVPLEYALLSTLVLFSVKVLLGYFAETHEKQKIMNVFGQYVPPVLVQTLARSPDSFSMEGEAREMTVLFCDVLDFSSISERLEPRELTSLLNEYLTAMTDVLQRHGATIDKYIGDAVMAFWGAPLPQPDHAARAVAAALDMQQAMDTVRTSFRARGWPAIEIGVGINTGIMNVGNMGSRFRVAYTVVGDAVNVAARLEALTRLYGVAILISESTIDAAGTLTAREIDHVRVKGKDRATRVFEPLAPGASDTAEDPRHQAGLDAYYRSDWDEAKRIFSELEATSPASAYYRAMLNRMAERSPPAGWRGVIVFGGSLNYSLEAAAPGED